MPLSDPAKKSITFSGALAVVNAIKTSIATAATPQVYTAGALNGSIGTATMSAPRRITATLAAHAASYVNGSTITIKGLNSAGASVSEVLTIAGTGGGTTLTTVGFFTQVTEIDVDAQADALGSFQFGTSDASVNSRSLRVGTAGNLHVQYGDGSTDTILNVAVGEVVPAMAAVIFGDSTAQGITAYI